MILIIKPKRNSSIDDFKKTAKAAMKRRNIDFSSYEDKLFAVYKKD